MPSRLPLRLFKRPLRLRSHLIAFFLLAMTPLFVFAVFMIYRSVEEERATFRRGAIERVRAIMTAVDIELKSSIKTLEALATSEALDRDDLRGFYDVAMRVFISQHDWTTINIGDVSGRRIIDLLGPIDGALPPLAEPELLKPVFESQQTAIGNLVLGPATGDLDFAIRVPVVRDRRTKYVLSGVVKPAVMGALLAKQQIPPGWVLTVTDAKGRIVARTLAAETSLGRSVAPELRQALAESSEGWRHGRSLEGANVYRAYTRSPFSGWSVSLNIPASVVDAPLHGTLSLVALFGAALMLTGVALALLFSRRTASSIEALSGIAKDLGLGNESGAAVAAAANNVPSQISEVEDVREVLLTARRLIEERSRERDAFERELWQQAGLLELSHDAIFVRVFPNGPIIYWNRGAEMLYGYSKSEAMGQSPGVLLETFHPRGMEVVAAALEEKGEWYGELVHTARDGRKVFVDSRHVLTAQPDGRRIVLETNRDISDLKRLNVELGKRVEERTAERDQFEEQLRQAQKMEALGTLAGGIAHDFNNILGIVVGWARELLSEGGGSQGLNAILSAGERGAAIVKQLLAFARKHTAGDKTVQLNRIIVETVEMLKAVMPKTIAFELDLDPALPELRGDANQLQQVIVNICLNAREAMADGGMISIRTAPGPVSKLRSGDCVALEISDSGVGMDEATLRRVFEPFFTMKEATGGTGLGLSVVYGIVQAHGGSIEVESAPGRGTTVALFFPLPSRAAVDLDLTRDEPAKIAGGGATLLVVDDEAYLVALLKTAAELRGFRVLTASDGVEAVEVYERNQKGIDVVVLDCGLPKLGGPAVFAKLKELNPEVVVIGVTGYLDPNIKSAMLQQGLREFLHKPCTPDEILAKAAEYCASASAVRGEEKTESQ